MGVIAVGQGPVGDRDGAAGAFSHILTGHLDMDAAGMGALGAVHGKKARHLGEDPLERPCLVAAAGLDHMTQRDAKEMEAREVAILKNLGFSDPYVIN